MLTWLVGGRTEENADRFVADAADRVAGRIQVTTDGDGMYLTAVRRALDIGEVEYAMLVKSYGTATASKVSQARKYNPMVRTGAKNERMIGRPDTDLVSTSIVERANLSMRAQMRRVTRLTNGFWKKAENHAHAVGLFFMFYNFCRPPPTSVKAANGNKVTPAMVAGVTNRVWNIEDLLGLMDPDQPLQSK